MEDSYIGWYYSAEFGAFNGFIFNEDKNISPEAWSGNIYGPFKTFQEAKRDAKEYFKADLNYTRNALKEVSKAKKPKY